MLASVIVLNWNGLDVLGPCLAAIEANTGELDYEVIVLDNGSEEAGIEAVVQPHPRVRLIKEPVNHGFSRGNNIAVRHARGEFVAFLNNDTLPRPGWLEPLIAAVRGGAGMAGARLVDREGRILFAGAYFHAPIAAYTPAYRNYPPGSASNSRPCEAYIACGILMRKDTFEALGGFDENYFQGYEDTDLCLKLRDAGQTIVYCPASCIEHLENVSMNRMRRRRRRSSKESNRRFFEARWRHRIHEFRLPDVASQVPLGDFNELDQLDRAVLDRIPAGARHVLHLDCGTGRLGAALKGLRSTVHVTGATDDLAAASVARSRLDAVEETATFVNAQGPESFDCLVLSRVLEASADPWSLLFSLRTWLRPGGTLVTRFDNIRHYKTFKRLALREWRYEPAGVLAESKLRFFSRSSIEDLLLFAGFRLAGLEAEEESSGVAVAARLAGNAARDMSVARFVVVAHKA
jgi:GT2 family glycosyltransferase